MRRRLSLLLATAVASACAGVGCLAPDPGEEATATPGDATADVADSIWVDDVAAETESAAEDSTAEAADTMSVDAAPDDGGDAAVAAEVESDSSGDAVIDGTPPVSIKCGDGVRGSDEECDDGLTDDAGVRRACTSTCRVVDLLALKAPPVADGGPVSLERTLGGGRHPFTPLTTGGFGLAFVDKSSGTAARVGVTTFAASGAASDVTISASGGTTASFTSNPVLAGLPGGKLAIAWNSLGGDSDGLGVALRLVDPATSTLSSIAFANSTTSFGQYDPDLLWIGSELVASWSDNSNVARGSDLKVRRFSATLMPLAAEEDLAVTLDDESDVALASFGTGWAAAWRSARGGVEAIKIKAGSSAWSVGPFLPGPYGSKPAFVALDATHLLVTFIVGVDPGDAGTPSSFELRVATLDLASTGTTTSSIIATATTPSQPSLARIGDRLFLAWRGDAVAADANGEELWLKELGWTSGVLTTTTPAITMPRWGEHRAGDQRSPAFAAAGANLFIAWDDFGRSLTPTAGAPDIVVELVPIPILRVTSDAGP